MPFEQSITQIQNLTKNAPSKLKYSNSFQPQPNIIPNLTLLYPGRINNLGDYRLEYNGTAFTHPDIVRAVHDCTLQGNGKIISDFLVDLYHNGLAANTNYNLYINVKRETFTLEQFKYLTYWLVLQEDINYPRPFKMGVRMPIIRYIEGAIAALHPKLLSLQDVINRTNNHGRPPAKAFNNPNVTNYLTYNIQQIK